MTKTKGIWTAVVLSALLALSALTLVLGGGYSPAFAEGYSAEASADEIVKAPLKLSLQGSGDTAYYRVDGVDTAVNLTDEEKQKLTVVIPATYTDGTTEAPVEEIAVNAFAKLTGNPQHNAGYTFVGVDLRGAANLRNIGYSAFYASSIAGELFIPKNIKNLGANAFSQTKITSLVFDEEIGSIDFGGNVFSEIKTLGSATVHIPANLSVPDLRTGVTNVFSGSSIGAFTVDENNQTYDLRDGILYRNTDSSRYLIAFPTGIDCAIRIDEGTTHIADRAFLGGSGTVVIPDTVKNFDPYCALNFKGTLVFETKDISGITLGGDTPDTAFGHNCHIVFADKALRDAAIATGGFLNVIINKGGSFIKEANVGYLSAVSGSASAGAAFSSDMSARQVEQLLDVAGAAIASEADEAPHSFDLTGLADVALPAGGLAVGENAITVAYGGLTGSATIEASAPTVASIEAEYTAPEGGVFTSTSLDSLRNHIVVTGVSTLGVDMGEIADYTLEGDLTAGDVELTVRVGEATTTVTIRGVKAVAVETISAELNLPSDVKIVEGMTLEQLKAYIVASATNNDGTSADASAAVLSVEGGVLKAGANTITVTLGDLTYTLVVDADAKSAPEDGLTGGGIAGIVIAVIILALILALLALFFFRADKAVGFKAFYVELWSKCVAVVKSWFPKKSGEDAVTDADSREDVIGDGESADEEIAEEAADAEGDRTDAEESASADADGDSDSDNEE